MGKKDEYRFNLRFDETDEMHRHFWHIGKCPAKVCFRMCFRK